MLSTPVLFLIFNRPESTAKVFEQIRKVQPRQLFIAADGPREHKDNDKEKCELVRKMVLEGIDWDCEIHTLFRSINLGCKRAVSEGINWFFDQVEEGIILEDDTVPETSFFSYCEELLSHYRYDSRILHINGISTQVKNRKEADSYYFSRYAHVWGWATWRRAWQKYNIELKGYDDFINSNILKNIVQSEMEYQYWISYFTQAKDNRIDTWDIQWLYSIWQSNGICIAPYTNLVRNIGFGVDATHTKEQGKLANQITQELTEIQHPQKVFLNLKADKHSFSQVFSPSVSFANRLRNIGYQYIPTNIYFKAKLIKEKIFKRVHAQGSEKF